MADSTYRVGVLLDLAAGRYRRGAKAAAKDTDRLGGTLRKAAGSGSLMGRRVTDGARRARREVRRTAEDSDRLGRALRRTGRDGEQSFAGLTRGARRYRTEMGLASSAAGRLRGGLLGIAGVAGGGFAIAAGLRRIVTMEERMERLGIQSGRSREEMAWLRKEVYATANLPEIRLDPSQVLSAVEAIVEKTGDLEFARDNLLLIAQSIQGSGGTGDALGRLSAELRKLGVADPAGVAQALNLLTAQGKSGAFTLGNMSAQGERLFSAFARLGYEGPGAVRQLGAISQMARQSTGSSEQAATAVEALLRTLSDAQKIDAIWTEFGVNVQDPTGAFRPLDQILKELVAATGGDPTALSGVFDAEAIRAISGLATPQGMGNYNRFLTIEAPPDMLARDAARIAETTGAQIQETKTDVEDWMQDKLTGPLGEFVTALTSFKDELLVGVGLLAGSWYAFKGLRAAGSLLWRLAGRGGGRGRGGPMGDQVRGSGRGRGGPRGDQVRLSGRGPGGPWGDQVRGSGRGRGGPRGDQVRLSGRGRGGPRGDQVRGSGRGRFGPMGDQVRLSGRGRGGPRGDQVRGSGRGRFGPMGDQVRGSGRGRFGPMGDQVRLSGRGRGGPRGDQVRGSGRGRFGPVGDQVRLSGRGRGGPRGDQVRGSGRGRFGPMGDQVRLSGRGPGGPWGDQVRGSGRG
ncbi:MAG: phage tail tape measure protein, partial [Rhodospirillaceae bacterium]|nr:phage tail tape measure protein [Rhodospirillaceae bacterium]